MENYHNLNQKLEFNANQDKYFLPFNKNLQFQNLFRGDSNLNKQKGRVYYINSKKEIHLTSRAKENEIGTNGPKMLTINFPPEFFITDNNNNNNSRKTGSHEKNIFIQQSMANNMELNDIGSDNEKIFANTAKKGFQDYNNENKDNIYKDKKQDKKNIEFFGQKQKILIKYNNNENTNNIQKKNIYYSGQGAPVLGKISAMKAGYNDLDINSVRRSSSNDKQKEKNYETSVSHIRTEGSDYKNTSNGGTAQTNFKSNSSSNSNKPFNKYTNNNQGNKTNSNLIYKSNSEYDNYNNNYSSNNSNNSKDKFTKNMLIYNESSNSNKLVFNPSSITNQRMIKKNSDSELFPSSISQLYMPINNYNNNAKEFKHLNNHQSYNNINENYYKKYNYYQNKSENHSKISSSQDKNSKSQSKEKNHTKTQTDFEKNNTSNFYENLIYEIQNHSKKNISSAAEYDKNILKIFEIKKNKIENLNLGITYKMYNGYKYNFNVKNQQIYILKEVSFNLGKGLIPSVEEWNKRYENDGLYLKIYGHENNSNQKQTTWIIQYPIGGESLNDIINSVGFYDQNFLFNIVTKIYKSIIKLKENINNEKYLNVSFCLCDIYININEHIKIIPPLIRHIPINSNSDKRITQNTLCNCKANLIIIQKLFNINKDCISFFCLGFLIIQIITQNLIFELTSYKHLLNFKNNANKKKCCLAHLILDIEREKLNGNKYLLFSHFLNMYPKSLLSFLHECTSFENNTPASSNKFLNLYDTNKNLNLSIKEILEITTMPKNEYIKFDAFLRDFENLYQNVQMNSDDYIRKLNSNKIIHVLSRAFNMDKEYFINKICQKMEKNNNYINNNNEKNNIEEKGFYNEKNNFNYDNNNNYSALFVGYNKKKNSGSNLNNNFNRQNNPRQLHNYRSSENYDYEYI